MTNQREHCGQCGFDSELYNHADTINSQHLIPQVLAAAIEGLEDEVLQRRPDGTTWSIAEYLDHVRLVTFANRFAIDSAVAEPGIDLGDPPDGEFANTAAVIDVAATMAAIETEFEAMRVCLAGLDDAAWDTPLRVGGKDLVVGWFARHVLHDSMHHLMDIGAIRAGFGYGPKTGAGQVTQISVSGGGVPKRAVPEAAVGPTGVGGDAQGDRKHHGRPIQAVCLWSADVIADLQADGHPIDAGNAGENITVVGVDWPSLRPGAQLMIGEVPMFITAHTIPCAKNAQWFSDRDFKRILHDRNPGMSRLYAVPLTTAVVRSGDHVRVG